MPGSGSGFTDLTSLVNVIQQGNQIATQILAALRSGATSSGPYNFGTIAWGAGSLATSGTIILTENQDILAHITSAFFSNGSAGGSITASININGTPITGLNNIVINTTGSANASGLNTVTPGSVVSVVLTSPVGTVSDGGVLTVKGVVG